MAPTDTATLGSAVAPKENKNGFILVERLAANASLAQDPDSPTLHTIKYQTPMYTLLLTSPFVASTCSKLVQNGIEKPTAMSSRLKNVAVKAPATSDDQAMMDVKRYPPS